MKEEIEKEAEDCLIKHFGGYIGETHVYICDKPKLISAMIEFTIAGRTKSEEEIEMLKIDNGHLLAELNASRINVINECLETIKHREHTLMKQTIDINIREIYTVLNALKTPESNNER